MQPKKKVNTPGKNTLPEQPKDPADIDLLDAYLELRQSEKCADERMAYRKLLNIMNARPRRK